MKLRIDYGRHGLEVNLSHAAQITVVESPRPAPLKDPDAAVRAALRTPIGARPLAEIARGRRNATVVISDKTRPVPNGAVLPPILETIETAGVSPDRIEILVGTGLHRANTPEELVEMTSREIVARYRIRNHAARSREEHVSLGRTSRGTEILLDRGYVEADLKIVTGLIEPHLMAGYSGGRKGVAPGLAGADMMRTLHGADMLEDHVGPGILEGNPFHEELLEIARRAGVDFLVNVSVDRQRAITGVFAGDLELAHEEGSRAVEREVRVDLPEAFDVVVASAGGYPLDATFYQAIKGLVGALNLVRRGGTVILAAELSEGVGGREFQDLLSKFRTPEEFVARIRAGFVSIDQWMLQHLCQVLRKAEVKLVTGPFDRSLLAPLPLTTVPSVEAALVETLRVYGADTRVAVVPEGPYVLATVRGRKLAIGRAWLDEAA